MRYFYVFFSLFLGKYLSIFLNSFFQWLPTDTIKLEFLEQITNIICHFTWNSISLLFICISLRELTLTQSLNLSTVCVHNLCQILKCSLTTHEPFIRSSVQTILLQAFLKHTKLKDILAEAETFQLFVDSVNMFSIKECLRYDTSSWSSLVDWFRELSAQNEPNLVRYIETEFNQFIEHDSNTDCEFTMQNKSAKLAKLILIHSDCVSPKMANNSTLPFKSIDCLRAKLVNCNRNVYMSTEKIEKCLFVFNFMISFVKPLDRQSFKLAKSLYDECGEHIVDYLLRRVSVADLSFRRLQFYISLLENLVNFVQQPSSLISDKLTKQLLPLVEANLDTQSNEFSLEWKRFICLSVYASLIQSNLKRNKSMELIQFALRNKEKLVRLKPLSKSQLQKLQNNSTGTDTAIKDDLIQQYSEFNGQYLEKIWQSKAFLMRHDISLDFTSEYADSLELVSPHCLASLIECAKSLRVTPGLPNVFQSILKLVWELREDSRLFSDSYQAYLDCLISQEVFKSNADFLITTLIDLIDKSGDKVCMVRPLVDRLLQLLQALNSNENELFIPILIRLLTFGDIYRKEKKNLKEIEIYLESFGETFGANQLLKAEYLHDAGVRITTLVYLLQSSGLNERFYSAFIRQLIAKDECLAEANQKLFINSLVHRERFRLWQVVLVMLNKFNSNDYSMLMDTAEKLLVSENQPSMRKTLFF